MPLSPVWNSYTSFLIALAPAFRKTYRASSNCYTTPDLIVIALFNLWNYFYRYNYWLNNNTSYSHCKPMTYIANCLPNSLLLYLQKLDFLGVAIHPATPAPTSPPGTRLILCLNLLFSNHWAFRKILVKGMASALCLSGMKMQSWKCSGYVPSRRWMQDVKDVRAGWQGACIFSGIF